MPRPCKRRRICRMPTAFRFGPIGTDGGGEIALTLDEYETLRLIDLLGYTQEECAAQMGVARTTVQAVCTAARRKVADALVNGRQLDIRGGHYTLCPKARECSGDCRRRCPHHGQNLPEIRKDALE